MGLGPAVCEHCYLLADYYPNKEDPTRQGDWLCPKCGLYCDGHYFLYKKDEQNLIDFYTTVYKENQGHKVS
jgi:hypothetical protein